MSRLFAKYMCVKSGTDDDFLEQYGQVLKMIGPTITSLERGEKFKFKCLDWFSFVSSGGEEKFVYDIVVSKEQIMWFISCDKKFSKYTEDEKAELIFKNLIMDLEVGGSDCDDIITNISFLQYFCFVSETVLDKTTKNTHLKKLGRVKKKSVELVFRDVCKENGKLGGRPKGSKNKVPQDLIDSVNQNLENYDQIVAKCIELDRLEEFITLQLDIDKVGKSKYNSVTFTRSIATKLFIVLRYLWKVKKGLIRQDKDYEKKKLIPWCVKYKFETELNELLEFGS